MPSTHQPLGIWQDRWPKASLEDYQSVSMGAVMWPRSPGHWPCGATRNFIPAFVEMISASALSPCENHTVWPFSFCASWLSSEEDGTGVNYHPQYPDEETEV